MSDTKETESYTTVELTLDNDEIIECAILTVCLLYTSDAADEL